MLPQQAKTDLSFINKQMDVINEDVPVKSKPVKQLYCLSDSTRLLMENDNPSGVTEKPENPKLASSKQVIKNPYTSNSRQLKLHIKQTNKVLDTLRSSNDKQSSRIFDNRKISIDEYTRHMRKKEIASVYENGSKTPTIYSQIKFNRKDDIEGQLN